MYNFGKKARQKQQSKTPILEFKSRVTQIERPHKILVTEDFEHQTKKKYRNIERVKGDKDLHVLGES